MIHVLKSFGTAGFDAHISCHLQQSAVVIDNPSRGLRERRCEATCHRHSQLQPPAALKSSSAARHPSVCRSAPADIQNTANQKTAKKITGRPEKRQTAAAGGEEIRSHRWVNRQANRAGAGWGARRDSGRSNRPLERAIGGRGRPFGFSSGLTFFFRGMFRSSDHCLVLPGANRRENIMRGQPRPLVRRFETLHALPIRLQIRNAKYMRDRTDNCTQLATENHANTLVDVRMFAVEENFILLRRLRFHIT